MLVVCYLEDTEIFGGELELTEDNVKDQVTHNQITIANELNNYFLNVAGSVSNKKIDEKGKGVS